MNDDIDILMITHNRPEYTKLTLGRLLDTCDERMRVWVWQNGDDAETLSVVQSFLSHPQLYRFNHSQENRKLNEPTNWLWQHATGTFFSKVDDDCLVPRGWADSLRLAHRDNALFGVIGCWHFHPHDFIPSLATKKIKEFDKGHFLLRNCWLGGSGYLMKRACVDQQGLLQAIGNFSTYCIDLALRGWIHGWYYPFLYQEHLDDPRSKHSLLKTDEDIQKWVPLSAAKNGVTTLAEWQGQLQRSARLVQRVPYDPKHYSGWRRQLKQGLRLVRRSIGVRHHW